MKTAIKHVKTNIQALVDEAKKAISSICITSTPYIVQINDISVDPLVINNQVIPGKMGSGLPWRVRRFSKRDAERIAKVTRNGSGTEGEAIGYIEATHNFIKTNETLLGLI